MRARGIILRIVVLCGTGIGLCWIAMLHAAPITVLLPSKIVANADFRRGDSNKPAVLVLHGFMATYNLNIVQTIIGELEDQGFTVLAPTLSLRINNRQSGANCEAVHTHTMETDIAEISWWIDWLKRKGYRNVEVIGFSTGGLQVAALFEKHVPAIVKKVILVSPIYMAGKPFPEAIEQADLLKANSLVKRNDTKLQQYSLSYCNENFVAPAQVFLSYKAWSKQRLFKAIKSIAVPSVIIVGGEDFRFGRHWINDLGSTGKRVEVIPRANHFFSSLQEFEFLEKLEKEISASK